MNAAGRRFARRAAERLQHAAHTARLTDLRLSAGDTPQAVADTIGTDVPHLTRLCRRAGRDDVARRLGGAR